MPSFIHLEKIEEENRYDASEIFYHETFALKKINKTK